MVDYIGPSYSSSEVHKKVIANLGDQAENDPRMIQFRRLAAQAKNDLYTGDFKQLGPTMSANTAVQRALHPAR